MEINKIKQEVVRKAKKAEQSGLCQYKSGNFSIIDRYKGLVYITPSGISREELTDDMIAVVDLEGNIVDAVCKPSIEVSMHINAYLLKPKAMGCSPFPFPICNSLRLYGKRDTAGNGRGGPLRGHSG